jgi:hypothetical protein
MLASASIIHGNAGEKRKLPTSVKTRPMRLRLLATNSILDQALIACHATAVGRAMTAHAPNVSFGFVCNWRWHR